VARLRVSLLAAASLLLVAQSSCPPPSFVRVDAPANGALIDDPSVHVSISVSRDFDAPESVVRVDGVDLIAALGLTPPFANASGVVSIGGTPVTIASFTYSIPAQQPVQISLDATGLAPGAHALEAEANPPSGPPVSTSSGFDQLSGLFGLELDLVANAGGPAKQVISATSVRKSALGESVAAPPVALSGGGTLRQGFVPAATGASP
jgi:hypothetical protein